MSKYISNKNRIIKTLFIVMLIAVFSFCLLAFFNGEKKKASAVSGISSALALPFSALEYKELSSPDDCCMKGNNLAFIDGNSLVIYNGAKNVFSTLSFSAPQQVKFLNENQLAVSASGALWKIDINTLIKAKLTDKDGNDIGGNKFDINDGFLVIAFGTTMKIYARSGNEFLTPEEISNKVDTSSPICLSATNRIYYIHNGFVCVCSPEGQDELRLFEQATGSFVATAEDIYFSTIDSIIRYSLENKSFTEMESEDSLFDLGKIDRPNSLFLFGNKLLITDKLNKNISLFEISGETLSYTGFSVAKDKTAFNRISSSAKDVEKHGDKIAVLDDFKFTVITVTDETEYDKDNFYNKLLKDFPFTPNFFALGETGALFIENSSASARFLDLSSDTFSDEIYLGNPTESCDITDVCYQSGYYYVLYIHQQSISSPIGGIVYKINEKNLEVKTLCTMEGIPSSPIFTVDLSENVYISSASVSNVILLSRENDYSPISLSYTETAGVIKLITDLGGGLFALTENGVTYYANEKKFSIPVSCYLDTDIHDAKISSFAFSLEDNICYFIFEDEEIITLTDKLPLISLSALYVPDDFVISGKNAKTPDDLSLMNLSADTNVYSVSIKEDEGVKTVIYNGLYKTDDKNGVFVCTVKLSASLSGDDSSKREIVFNVLVNKTEKGKPDVFLVDSAFCKNVEKETVIPDYDNAYVSTSAGMYFFPIITVDADFSLFDGTEIRIPKETKISVNEIIKYNGIDFYYGTAVVNGTAYSGYIPYTFTVKNLYSEPIGNVFTLSKTVATDVYSDEAMIIKVFELKNETEVRVFEDRNGKAKIEYYDGTDWKTGYISSSAFIKPVDNTVRNVIIIICVTACVCATMIFFVLYRKSEKRI